jgi:hypothetical protein
MNLEITAYNDKQSADDKEICMALTTLIDTEIN